MRFHKQNLDDGLIKKYLTYGRCWIGPYEKSIDIEWMAPAWRSCRFDFGINTGDSNDKISFTLALCLFYFHISLPFYQFKVGHWNKYKGVPIFIHEDRRFSLYFHDWGIWLTVWAEAMGEWNKNLPWYKQTYCFHILDLLFGKRKFSEVILEQGECLVPMPEGCYSATFKKSICKWKRTRSLLNLTRIGWWFDIERGIPFEGKGENSWDCGEDALFGTGSSKETLSEAIGDIVGCALRNREKYGWRRKKEAVMAIR